MRWILLSCCLVGANALAEVITDGTMGAVVSLNGDMEITESLGTRVGDNLFHSFETFNVYSGESVLFSATTPLDHVVSRVTGGEPSNIGGFLGSNIPGADLWFLNPAGLVFGEGAFVDVPASIHVSTADYLTFEDGGRFGVELSNTADTSLTMAHPSHFGFLHGTGTVSVQDTFLFAPPGQTLGVYGSDVQITRAGLDVSDGRVVLASVTDGEIAYDAGSDFDPMSGGPLILSEAFVGSNGGEVSGQIVIRGGEIFVSNNSTVESSNFGEAEGLGIDIKGRDLEISGGSVVAAHPGLTADGGDVDVALNGRLSITGGSQIDTSPFDSGAGGDVNVTAAEVLITGSREEDSQPSWIYTRSGLGDGGNVTISAETLEISEGGLIFGGDGGPGASGDIHIEATTSVLLSSRTFRWIQGGIVATAIDIGGGGDIEITTPDLSIVDGARIWTRTRGPGDGGSVTLDVGTLTMGGHSETNFGNTSIFTGSVFTGAGGDLQIHADEVVIGEGASLDTSAYFGDQAIIIDAGNIDIVSGFTRIGPFATVLAEGTDFSAGGAVNITGNVLEMIGSSLISSRGRDGGDIAINQAESMTMGGDSAIITNTDFGTGGDIRITVPDMLMTNASTLASDIFGAGQQAGSIIVNADNLTILDGALIEAAACSCTFGNAGSIVLNITDSLRLSLNDPLSTEFGISQITTSTLGIGDAGDITINAGTVMLDARSLISSESETDQEEVDFVSELFGEPVRAGNAGTVSITAQNISVFDGARISTFAGLSAGGSVELQVAEQLLVRDGEISSAANGATTDDSGGNVFINTGIVSLSNSSVVANANAGDGGNILITSGFFFTSPSSVIDASSRTGLDGEVVIESPNQITHSIDAISLPEFESPELLKDKCILQIKGEQSSLTVEGEEGLSPAPDDWLLTPLGASSPVVGAGLAGLDRCMGHATGG